MYDRRNDIMRSQYDHLKRCLYTCHGNPEYGSIVCNNYAPTSHNGLCVWYNTLMSDKVKLEQGKKNDLTFPILEKILYDSSDIYL